MNEETPPAWAEMVESRTPFDEFCQALKGAATLTFAAREDGNLRLI
jgi:hypothetical protein